MENAKCKWPLVLGVLCVVVVCLNFFEKFFGGKFKYVIRNNSEFLAGNLNANGEF